MGEDSKDIKFIKNNLAKNTNFNFIKKVSTPTIKKKRFIDRLTNHKLLGVYSINDRELTQAENKKLEKIIFNKKYNSNDLIIISDYGHGFISPKMAKKICSKYKNIFLNTQLNAANIGFHTLKNYNNFNSLVINESELRHEFKDRYSEVRILIKKLSKSLKVKNILVTRGANGALYYNVLKNIFYETPAYASKIIDKVGAGDTLLAIFSICFYNKIPADLSLFIASLAASSVVESMGNSMKIDKVSLLKSIQYFLK
jgi:bifunctional ADP-heptose synthase (sugar kinase/adenylyltransferase)